MQVELSGDERDALARFIRSTINADRYPLSPRLAPLKAILARLDPKPQAQPLPPSTPRRAKLGNVREPYGTGFPGRLNSHAGQQTPAENESRSRRKNPAENAASSAEMVA